MMQRAVERRRKTAAAQSTGVISKRPRGRGREGGEGEGERGDGDGGGGRRVQYNEI